MTGYKESLLNQFYRSSKNILVADINETISMVPLLPVTIPNAVIKGNSNSETCSIIKLNFLLLMQDLILKRKLHELKEKTLQQ